MSSTWAVGLDLLGYKGDATEQPLCPACHGGRLHPYAVSFNFPLAAPTGLFHTHEAVDYLEGWVAICVGNRQYLRDRDPKATGVPEVPACGFTMSLTPHRLMRA